MKKIIILSVVALLLVACKKEKYEGRQSFWFNALTSYNLNELAGASTLTFYVDDEIVSTVNVSEYKISAPACGEGQFLYTDKMYKKETEVHSFKIIDNNNYTFWKGKFTTKESTCNIAQLSF